ncbi:hypothetical protein BLNAU_477 [Blattamonas nauphoetae]|uniref:Galactose oxidase n=1 Tax=Blattamonas nauphoetae TaxID=2049346 RepID=A0ABQ9YLC9_9EUKA|nr:hypothetical protein BLNAU_477 [Blattamonas nauphoetae]
MTESIPEWNSFVPSIPQGRCNHTAVAYNDQLYFFGGLGDDPHSTLRVNPKTKESEVTSTKLEQRYGHSGNLIGSHTYLFGGRVGSARTDELVDWNMDDGTFHSMKKSGDVPAPRNNHVGIVYDGSLVVFGGYDREGDDEERDAILYDDMFIYRFGEKKWKKIIPSNPPGDPNLPGKIYLHSGCLVNETDFYVFGGCHKPELRNKPSNTTNDFYVFNFPSLSWKKLEPPPSDIDATTKVASLASPGYLTLGGRHWPSPRQSASMFEYKGTIILYGGNVANSLYTDLWQYIPSLKQWICITTQGNSPSQKSLPSVCLLGDTLYVHGGVRKQKTFSDIYYINISSLVHESLWKVHQALGYPILQPSVIPPVIHSSKAHMSDDIQFGGAVSQFEIYFNGREGLVNRPSDLRTKLSKLASTQGEDLSFLRHEISKIEETSEEIKQDAPNQTKSRLLTKQARRSNDRFNPLIHTPSSTNTAPLGLSSSLPFHQIIKETVIPIPLHELGFSTYEFNMLSLICDIDTCDSFLLLTNDPAQPTVSPAQSWANLGIVEPAGSFEYPVLVHSSIINARCPQLNNYLIPRNSHREFDTIRQEWADFRAKREKAAIPASLLKAIPDKLKIYFQELDKHCQTSQQNRLTGLSLDAVAELLAYVYTDKVVPTLFIPPLRNDKFFLKLVEDTITIVEQQDAGNSPILDDMFWELKTAQIGIKECVPNWFVQLSKKVAKGNSEQLSDQKHPSTHVLDDDQDAGLLSTIPSVQLHAKAEEWNLAGLKTQMYNHLLFIATPDAIPGIVTACSQYKQVKLQKMFDGFQKQAKKLGIL